MVFAVPIEKVVFIDLTAGETALFMTYEQLKLKRRICLLLLGRGLSTEEMAEVLDADAVAVEDALNELAERGIAKNTYLNNPESN